MNDKPSRLRSGLMVWLAVVAVLALAVYAGVRIGVVRPDGLGRNDVGQIVYFVVLLAFVGSALLGRGLGAGEVLRATVTWLAILLLLVGAYAYRTELAIVGGRIMAVLAPGVPISGRLAGEADSSSVVIQRSLDGHFAILADVDRVPMTLMVDTGASYVTLTTDDAQRIGVKLPDLHYSVPIRTANGPIKAAPVTISRLAIGPIVRNDVQALVAPASSLDQSLLGMSYLDTLTSYAISGDRLVLKP